MCDAPAARSLAKGKRAWTAGIKPRAAAAAGTSTAGGSRGKSEYEAGTPVPTMDV